MLSFYNFCTLPSEEQSDFILENGEFVFAIETGEYKVGLFYLFDFFVEVYFRYKDGMIIKINPFRDSNKLEPFLEHIDISALEV